MFKIAYCAGHHLGNTKGVPNYMGLGDIREWTLNDRVARHFAEAAASYEGVELLRTDDPTGKTLIDIPQRADAANKWGADVYIDMHHNGGINGGSGGGAVAFSRPGDEKSGAYAATIYEVLIEAGGLKGNRYDPLIEKNWDTMKYSKMPAVLMEYGFMDSKTDAPIIITDAHAQLAAYATMEGIAKVAGLRKKSAKKEEAPAAGDKIYRVQVGAYIVLDNAEAMLKRIQAAGFPEAFIAASDLVPSADKSIDELAQEVIDGRHGAGDARRESLGEMYEAVQLRVNELMKV